MGPQAIIVGGILAKDPAQMSLSEHDQVVDTLPSDRAGQSSSVLTGGRPPPTAISSASKGESQLDASVRLR
jgi:hypothetical protein